MTSRLVSEARPIAWECLSGKERGLIEKGADVWIKAVVDDAARKKVPVDAIDERRSGRVLFIDGPRGAGKTSLLLTILKRWRNGSKTTDANEKGPCNENLRVLLPVLDFDPLPPGMPLHGWLIEAWRKEVREVGQEALSRQAPVPRT